MSLVNFHGISPGTAAFEGLHREFIRLNYLSVASDEELFAGLAHLLQKWKRPSPKRGMDGRN